MTGALSQTVKYALRSAAWLAAQDRGERFSADAIAAATVVPPAFLRKVLRQLVQAGLLDAEKGHHGGFRLARPPDQIRYLDVLLAVNVDLHEDSCAFGWGRCDPELPCPLHASYVALKQGLIAWAAGHTLSDVDWSNLPHHVPTGG